MWGHGLFHKAAFLFELVALAAILVFSAMFILPSWRSNRAYMAGAVLFGPVCGWVALRVGVPEGFSVLIACAATLTAPATIMAVEGKTLSQLMDEIKRVRERNGKGKDKSE